VTDQKAYTDGNSLPANEERTLEEKARVEGPYHKLTKGGNLFVAEIEEKEAQKPESLYKLANLIEQYDIGYASIQTKKIECPHCNYESTKLQLENCPNCGYSFS